MTALNSANRDALSWLRDWCPVAVLDGTILVYRFNRPPGARPAQPLPASPAPLCSGPWSSPPLLRSWADGLRDQLSRIYAHDDTHPLAA